MSFNAGMTNFYYSNVGNKCYLFFVSVWPLVNLIDRIITLNDVQIQERMEIDVNFAKLPPLEFFLFSLYLSLLMYL